MENFENSERDQRKQLFEEVHRAADAVDELMDELYNAPLEEKESRDEIVSRLEKAQQRQNSALDTWIEFLKKEK